MKIIRSVFCLALLSLSAFAAAPSKTANLLAFWDSRTNVTVTSGRVTSWADHGGTNTLANSDTNTAPWFYYGPDMRPEVLFQWGSSSAWNTNYLSVGASLTGIQSDNYTLVAVVRFSNVQNQSLWMWTSWGFAGINITSEKLASTVRVASDLWPMCSKQIIIMSQSASAVIIRQNNVRESKAAVGSTGLTGGRLGGIALGERFGGTVEALLVYNTALSQSEEDSTVAWAASEYGVATNYNRYAVFVGDSLAAGVGATNNLSTAFQASLRYPEIAIYNKGIGGQLIGTNGSGMVADLPQVNPIARTGKLNYLIVDAGRNDMNSGGFTGAQTFGRLTNYFGQCSTNWTKLVDITQAYNSNTPTALSNFNVLVRTSGAGNFMTHFSDSGYTSPIETRLQSFSTNYFDPDGLHLNYAGYGVTLEHAQFPMNTHRRGSFF